MIRELMIEMHNKKEIYIANKTEANRIVERIVYKIDPNNIPDIEDLKKMIEEET